MVKGYLDLSEIEKERVKRFTFRNIQQRKTFEDLDNIFKQKINGYGKGSYVYFNQDKVIGTAQVVLESCEMLKVAYIYAIDVKEEYLNKALAIKDLIKRGIEISKQEGAREVFLCFNKGLLGIFEVLGYKYDYYSALMTLENDKKAKIKLSLVRLTDSNKEVYMHTINKSFNDMPHGMYCYMEDVEKHLKRQNENYYNFIVQKENVIVGVLNVELDQRKGIFDIGLSKEFRGSGLGRELLETAIAFIKSKGRREVELIVVKKNKIAYNMYQRRGFVEKDVIGYWARLDIEHKYIRWKSVK
ncbi:MAG: GNAT family N-acetyltransferase [Sarcina sp.]